MNVQVWKIVATKWRTLEETVQPLSIVEEITIKAVKEIKDKGLLQSSLDYLKSGSSELDNDGDWP
ncbi:hypothetical protein JOC85_001158 [Bacillus mesophilus]|uniref:Uncharacterized protein n=1 Tax=Bacillus mesophilus TaxID=1808955 RepID=A0A6M0Q6L6_9BACI|nr:hypothetical protein [Bacillus mesophilus]MBM7660391.1 hypothetical protein [Bacillus mesophilus]NEY71100.1 hypothetical protein [Bacillus mesophilus]